MANGDNAGVIATAASRAMVCGCSAIGPTQIDIGVAAGAVFHIAGESAIASRRVPLGQLPVLSRLISLLRRIPAVKWAFTRLRPLPHGGSIDAAPIATDDSPAIVVDVAEAARTPDISISADPTLSDPGTAVADPVAEDDTAISVIAESPPTVQTDTSDSDGSSPETPTRGQRGRRGGGFDLVCRRGDRAR
ncbi:hypothetical protein [Bradyrhizobium diazoefficiens]